jgi:DNA-directed RNA polymerase specialized sigma subunit
VLITGSNAMGKARTREDLKHRYEKYLHSRTIFGKRLRVICVPKDMVENTINLSGDGIEDRVIAKDMIHKFKLWLPEKRWRRLEQYYHGDTLKEIADCEGVSEAAISEYNKISREKLKQRLEE